MGVEENLNKPEYQPLPPQEEGDGRLARERLPVTHKVYLVFENAMKRSDAWDLISAEHGQQYHKGGPLAGLEWETIDNRQQQNGLELSFSNFSETTEQELRHLMHSHGFKTTISVVPQERVQ